MTFLIYGANGYTGELIAREAKQRGLAPVLAGRSRERVTALAAELGLSHRVFALESPAQIARELGGVRLVLHCAGPFSATSAPMIAGCLAAGAHYLDITGEIDAIEHALAQHAAAERAGIVICPAVGFDVIPTDCVALALKQALPDAIELALGFDSRSALSAGTAKSSVEGLALGGRMRKGGQIVAMPLAHELRRIDFGDGEKLATTIPWGDIASAFHTTGIPDIRVFAAAPPRTIAGVKRLNYVRWLLRLGPVQAFAKRRAAKARGPSAEERANTPTYVWGEAVNAAGQKRTARVRTANGYSVTIVGSLAVVDYLIGEGKVRSGSRPSNAAPPRPGSYTPAKLMGADLVSRLPGSSRLHVE